MIHAYNQLYLNDASVNLATAFDFAINTCNLELNTFEKILKNSNIMKSFGRGNPLYVSGKSGPELVFCLTEQAGLQVKYSTTEIQINRSEEFWAGWALAHYQWYTSQSFSKILNIVSLEEILSMYKIYHEMDITHFINDLSNIISKKDRKTNLYHYRKMLGYTQKQLAEISEVPVRMIQLYEQRVNDIDKAQGHTLYKLATALCCDIEDLLENPQFI